MSTPLECLIIVDYTKGNHRDYWVVLGIPFSFWAYENLWIITDGCAQFYSYMCFLLTRCRLSIFFCSDYTIIGITKATNDTGFIEKNMYILILKQFLHVDPFRLFGF